MLIWTDRIFAQHDQLRQDWIEATEAIEKAHALVIPARRRLDESRDEVEELMTELEEARTASKEKRKAFTAKPKPRASWPRASSREIRVIV